MSDEPKFGDRYRIFWRNTRPGYVGEVRNYTTDGNGYRSVPILIDDALIQEMSMRFILSTWGSQGPKVIVSSAFMDFPLNFREAGIWHEIGHIHHEHILNYEYQDQAGLRVARIAAIERGQVLSSEAEADRFAIARIGKDALLRFLIYALETRPKGGKLVWNNAGRRELELRIAAIEAL